MAAAVLAAVLAGGRGTRIGGAKPCVLLAGRPLIAYPLAAAHAAGLETVVVAKRHTPLPSCAREQALWEPAQPHHPLLGAVTALAHAAARSPARSVLLLGCDMPFLTGELLAWLAALEGPAIARSGGRPQPLLARCVPAQLPALRRALAQRQAFAAALSGLAPRVLDEHELSRFGAPSTPVLQRQRPRRPGSPSAGSRSGPGSCSAGVGWGSCETQRGGQGGGSPMRCAIADSSSSVRPLRAAIQQGDGRRAALRAVRGEPRERQDRLDLRLARSGCPRLLREGADPLLARHRASLDRRGGARVRVHR